MNKLSISSTVGARAVLRAAQFVGLSEIRSNAVWDKISTSERDAIADEFKGELLRVGWQSGWPYCMAFCEVVYKYAYQGRPELPKVRSMLTPGCLLSWQRAAAEGWTTLSPSIGSIGIMKKGSSAQGHAFIVTAVDGSKLYTVEANTWPGAVTPEQDRNGDGVYRKTRQLVFKPTTGLHLLGFISPFVYA